MSLTRTLVERLCCFARDCRGLSAVEFGLMLPVILGLFMGSFDVGRLALANLKIFNAASSMADLVARDKKITATTLADLFGAATQIANPFDLSAAGKVIITSVSADTDDDPRIFWQSSGAGTLAANSVVGSVVGAVANLPPDLEVEAQETIIVAEVFYQFVPYFGLLTSTTTVYHSAYYRPRLGTLRQIE